MLIIALKSIKLIQFTSGMHFIPIHIKTINIKLDAFIVNVIKFFSMFPHWIYSIT